MLIANCVKFDLVLFQPIHSVIWLGVRAQETERGRQWERENWLAGCVYIPEEDINMNYAFFKWCYHYRATSVANVVSDTPVSICFSIDYYMAEIKFPYPQGSGTSSYHSEILTVDTRLSIQRYYDAQILLNWRPLSLSLYILHQPSLKLMKNPRIDIQKIGWVNH